MEFRLERVIVRNNHEVGTVMEVANQVVELGGGDESARVALEVTNQVAA